ncbi:MAG: hypothetical protein WA004_18700 [Saprospiraceae bacterium]
MKDIPIFNRVNTRYHIDLCANTRGTPFSPFQQIQKRRLRLLAVEIGSE